MTHLRAHGTSDITAIMADSVTRIIVRLMALSGLIKQIAKRGRAFFGNGTQRQGNFVVQGRRVVRRSVMRRAINAPISVR